MSLGHKPFNDPNVRDVDADYRQAYLAEYEKFTAMGDTVRAAAVAVELKRLGHDVAPKRTAKEKATATHVTEKAVSE